MDISLFDYNLPKERIAQFPLENRDNSRMMILKYKSREIFHRMFRDLPDYLNAGDVIVINRTKVIRARLFGAKEKTGTKVEVFLLKEIEKNLWECLVRPGSRIRERISIEFGNNIKCEVVSRTSFGGRIVRFNIEEDILTCLDKIGHIPLPPYITREDNKEFDGERYQTIYADKEGSVAAPTAGIGFWSWSCMGQMAMFSGLAFLSRRDEECPLLSPSDNPRAAAGS
mgnify:CR=1 FL=1